MRLSDPKACVLWKEPDALSSERVYGLLEMVEVYVEESHFRRDLRRCRTCGQRYFYQFREEVDWVDGEDPQYRIYLPVNTDQEIETLKAAGMGEIEKYAPQLRADWPKGVPSPRYHWVRAN